MMRLTLGEDTKGEIVRDAADDSEPGAAEVVDYYWGADLSGTVDGAGGVGGLLTVSVNGALYLPLCDANGNVTAYIDETGAVVAEYRYDAFGNTVSRSGAMADFFAFRFSTKYHDAETGLYYYGLRYLKPSWGRWISRDPIEESGGGNLYAFCGNDGVNGIDPLGMFTVNAVNYSPRHSSKSDFWLGVYLDLLDDEADGYIKVYKKINIDLKPCGGGTRMPPQEQELVTYIRVSNKRSTNKQLMYTVSIQGEKNERVYVELASLSTYNNFCGTISFKFELGFSKRYGTSEFGERWNGENLFGSLDKRRALPYYKPGKNPLTSISSASFEGTLKYMCNSSFGMDLINVKTSENWVRTYFDRLGEGDISRKGGEKEEHGVESFPL